MANMSSTKQKLSELSQRYGAALRRHLKPGRSSNLPSAVALGKQAVGQGLETLELARIHERALTLVKPFGLRSKTLKRAEIFFSEALTPIVETHRAARQSKVDLKRLNAMLIRRTIELAATNRMLKRGVFRRQNVEAALRKSGVHYA